MSNKIGDLGCCGGHVFTWITSTLVQERPEGLTCGCGYYIIENREVKVNENIQAIYDSRWEREMKRYNNPMGIVCMN